MAKAIIAAKLAGQEANNLRRRLAQSGQRRLGEILLWRGVTHEKRAGAVTESWRKWHLANERKKIESGGGIENRRGRRAAKNGENGVMATVKCRASAAPKMRAARHAPRAARRASSAASARRKLACAHQHSRYGISDTAAGIVGGA